MEIRIEWSELSERQLKDIFDYYSIKASPRIARNIINRIISRVSVLKKNPLSGVKEDLLNQYSEDFRFLIQGNYKILYWKYENQITIASVFDCRQNPQKLDRIEE